MKKILSLVLAVMVCFSLFVGCNNEGKESVDNTAANNSSDQKASTDSKESDGETKGGNIALLIPSPVGDPFIALCVKGLEKLADETNSELKIIETLDKAEYEDQVRAMAEIGANPVYCMWGDLSELAVKVAPEYPETTFILADVYMETNEPNVSSISVDPYASSFIAGVVAANTTENKNVGFIAHADRPVSRRYRDGYMSGIEYVNPDI